MKHFCLLAALLATAIVAPAANADVVTFSGLSNFSNYTESGMTMTSGSVWNFPAPQMAHMDGGLATFKLTAGGTFELQSVDMVSSGGSGPGHFEGYLNGILVSAVNIPGSAGTFNFGPLFGNIDELRVSVPGSHFTFDNLTFVPNPEPATMLAWGLIMGVGAVGYRMRKRKIVA